MYNLICLIFKVAKPKIKLKINVMIVPAFWKIEKKIMRKKRIKNNMKNNMKSSRSKYYNKISI